MISFTLPLFTKIKTWSWRASTVGKAVSCKWLTRVGFTPSHMITSTGGEQSKEQPRSRAGYGHQKINK